MPSQNQKSIFTPVNAAVAFRYCNPEASDYEQYMNFLWEFGYAERGFNIGDSMPTRYRSRVLEMPVMMQARIPLGEHLNLLVTGILYGTYYLSTTRAHYNEHGTSITEPYSHDPHFFDLSLGGFEYGVGGGLGVSLRFDRTDFTLDARYMAAMSYLYKPNVSRYESMPMQIIFSFGVMRRIGK